MKLNLGQESVNGLFNMWLAIAMPDRRGFAFRI
jgi:hypothetical protein